jgi:hypothetical protein
MRSQDRGTGRVERPGSGKLRVEKQRALKPHDPQDLREHVHTVNLCRMSVGLDKNTERWIKYARP